VGAFAGELGSPEIVATPIVEISPGYLKWLCEQVKA